jgi:two-component sensor histidine kinase
LEQANRDLERRVQERTSDLAMERGRIEHLLRELSHRVGNNLSMVSSFLLLEAMKAEDDKVRRALENAHQRILGIASAQRRLRIDTDSAHVDVAPYLAAIVEDVRQTLPGEGISLVIEAEALQLRGADAVALGIIVNELVTNALKHAFPDGQGSVAVSLATQGGSVLLEVSDNGSGFSGNEGAGLGALLVRSMVAALEGRAARTIGGGPRPGTRWVIRFPLRTLPTQTAALRAETGL